MIPTPGYIVTFGEDLGALQLTRASLPDKTFILANDDLLQQLFSNRVLFQTNDDIKWHTTMDHELHTPKVCNVIAGVGGTQL